MLEHLLDDQRGLAAWQIELRKRHDDPLECDEVYLHVAPDGNINEDTLKDLLIRRFHEVTEMTPNAILFHTVPELRNLLGVGRLLKEEKVADRRQGLGQPGHGQSQSQPQTATPG